MNRTTQLLAILCLLLVLPVNSYAYLDIGTGSYFFQLAIGFFVGSLFAVKMFWKRITVFRKGLFSHHESKPEESPDDP